MFVHSFESQLKTFFKIGDFKEKKTQKIYIINPTLSL